MTDRHNKTTKLFIAHVFPYDKQVIFSDLSAEIDTGRYE